MQTTVDQEKIIFNYILKKPSYYNKLNVGFFKNPDLDNLAKLAKTFFVKYSDSPTRDQIKALIDDAELTIPHSIVDQVFEINLDQYDEDWIKSTAEGWLKWQNFHKNLLRTIEFVKDNKVSPENVDDVIHKSVGILSDDGVISFDTDIGLDFFNPKHHRQRADKKVKSGKTFVDNLTSGGYDLKSLVIYAGEQNSGKCSSYDTLINVRNKKTGEIKRVKIGDFFNQIKNNSKYDKL